MRCPRCPGPSQGYLCSCVCDGGPLGRARLPARLPTPCSWRPGRGCLLRPGPFQHGLWVCAPLQPRPVQAVAAAGRALSSSHVAVLTVCLLPSCRRDPEGADLRGEAGRLQRGCPCQGRCLLRVLGLRASLRAAGAEALRDLHCQVKPAAWVRWAPGCHTDGAARTVPVGEQGGGFRRPESRSCPKYWSSAQQAQVAAGPGCAAEACGGTGQGGPAAWGA